MNIASRFFPLVAAAAASTAATNALSSDAGRSAPWATSSLNNNQSLREKIIHGASLKLLKKEEEDPTSSSGDTPPALRAREESCNANAPEGQYSYYVRECHRSGEYKSVICEHDLRLLLFGFEKKKTLTRPASRHRGRNRRNNGHAHGIFPSWLPAVVRFLHQEIQIQSLANVLRRHGRMRQGALHRLRRPGGIATIIVAVIIIDGIIIRGRANRRIL